MKTNVTCKQAILSVLELIEVKAIKFLVFKFTNFCGVEHSITLLASQVNLKLLQQGKVFDGRVILGSAVADNVEVLLKPDISTAQLDPFLADKTLVLRCEAYNAKTMQPILSCSRGVVLRAQSYFRAQDFADTCYVGSQLEFYLQNDLTAKLGLGVLSDTSQDLRATIAQILTSLGGVVDWYCRDSLNIDGNIFSLGSSELMVQADRVQDFKYVVSNVAQSFGKVATLVAESAQGMICTQALGLANNNVLAVNSFKLSPSALYYIGGIIRHIKAINAFTNPKIDSYQRLVIDGMMIKMPYCLSRLAVIGIDPIANPYLAFAAIMLAGIDGVVNKIEPESLCEDNVWVIPGVASSLEDALVALELDNDFLCQGGVFSADILAQYIYLTRQDLK